VPRRFSSARIWRLTAGCVTPSRSAATEKLRRSTTVQKAASCRVSITKAYTTARAAPQRDDALRAVRVGRRWSHALPAVRTRIAGRHDLAIVALRRGHRPT
jgi:hypothetical protein